MPTLSHAHSLPTMPAHSLPVRPLINPANHRMPAESIVRADWEAGVTRLEMTRLYGVSHHAINNFMRLRLPRWRRERARKPLRANAGKIVVFRENFVDHAIRLVPISLPRISMHVAWLEQRA